MLKHQKLEISKKNSWTEHVALSKEEAAGEFEARLREIFNYQTGVVLAYLDHAIRIGSFEGGKIKLMEEKLEPEFIQKLRIFNEEAELFLWRGDEGGFNGRYRVDGSGEVCSCVDMVQYLWGTRAIEQGNRLIMEEGKGVRVSIPLKLIGKANKNNSRALVKIRNYIGYLDETGQAGYVDCRMTGLEIE